MWYFNPNSYPSLAPCVIEKETAKQFVVRTKTASGMSSYSYRVSKDDNRVFENKEDALAAYRKHTENKIAGLHGNIKYYQESLESAQKMVEEYHE